MAAPCSISLLVTSRSFLLFLAALGSIMLPAAPRTVQSIPAPARDHHLFAGVNLYAEFDGEMLPVHRLDGRRVVVASAAGPTPLPFQQRGLQWKMIAKVSNVSVQVDDLKSRPVFSLKNDPIRQSLAAQTAIAEYFSGQIDRANLAAREAAEIARLSPNASVESGEPSGFLVSAGGNVSTAPSLDEISSAVDNLGEDLGADFFGDQAEQAQQDGQFDALLVTGQVSSPVPLADAHALVVARIRIDGEFFDLNFHDRIGQVDAVPRRISLERTDLPPGYELVESRLYLFNHSEELATNLSQRRLDLTEEEARQYVNLDHIAQHRGETRPARPVWALAPPALAQARHPDRYAITVIVRLDATGALLGIESSGQIVPASVEAVIRQMVFVPALNNGAPVASSLTFNPADFFKQS